MRTACALGVLVLVAGAARAATITVGPYVQAANADGFTVVYETDQPARGQVQANGASVADASASTHHESRISGLKAATRYPYEVRLDGKSAFAGETRTLPEHAPFTFVVYGDNRQGGAVEQALAERIRAETPDFAVHTGDFVRKGDDEQGWRESFANERQLLSEIAIFPVFGNHEKWGDPEGDFTRRFFPLLRAQRYYSMRIAGSAFIVLDGNQPEDATQIAWLEHQLAAAHDAQHVFVFVHQPPFSLGDHCGSATAQKAWVDLFERFHVRAVFAGHDHAYERMERNGVRYFVTGGGGAPLYDERPCGDLDRSAKKLYAEEHHYLRVRVTADRVEVTAVRADPVKPPIEAVALTAHDSFLPAGPPLVPDDDWPSSLHRRIYRNRQWTYAAGCLLLLVFVGGRFRRRRA